MKEIIPPARMIYTMEELDSSGNMYSAPPSYNKQAGKQNNEGGLN